MLQLESQSLTELTHSITDKLITESDQKDEESDDTIDKPDPNPKYNKTKQKYKNSNIKKTRSQEEFTELHKLCSKQEMCNSKILVKHSTKSNKSDPIKFRKSKNHQSNKK